MTRKFLFIHVPKTAGTSLEVFFGRTLGNFFVQANSPAQLAQRDPCLGRVSDLADIKRILATHSGLSLHVDSNFEAERRTADFRSLAPYVFDPEHVDYFSQFTILMMLRHPFHRFLSEHAFVRTMKAEDPGFLSDLEVDDIEAYLHKVHPNPVLHFLLEPELRNPRIVTMGDLEWVKARIADYPIHVGVLERFDASVAMFARLMDRDFTAADIPALNVGTGPAEMDAGLEAAFEQRNPLDMELYAFALQRLGATDPPSSSAGPRGD